MSYRMLSLLVVSLLTISLSGCSGITLHGFVKNELKFDKRCAQKKFFDKNDNLTPIAGDDGEISNEYILALISGHAKIDCFLDCAIAEAPKHETRLYRGHVLLSLLASYGAYNLSVGQYEESVGDAITLLTHIREAERSLRGASSVVKPVIQPRPYQERPFRLNRISNMLEVALYAERPTLRRAKSSVRSLVGAIASKAPPSIMADGVKGAMTGISKSIHLRLYGKAYLKDAQDDLIRFKDGFDIPKKDDWDRRSKMIEDACKRIAVFAQLDKFDCIPDGEDENNEQS
ncbi:MAG: hypothetical protein ABW152_01460 [Candidatus Thiodiazotropha endolucinida]